MKYNNIKLTFISQTAKTTDEVFPFIQKVLPNCTVKKSLSQIKFKSLLQQSTFFYYKSSDIKTFKDRLISLLITLLGKNFRSRLCSYRKIIKNHLLEENSPYKFIVYGYHIYDLFSINTSNLKENSFIFSLDGIYTLYLWQFELLKQKINHQINPNTKCCIVYNCFSLPFLKFLQSIYPNSQIIARYHDMIEKDKHKKFIKKAKSLTNCYFESYSQRNAEELNINYWPNSVNFITVQNKYLGSTSETFDLYFLGIADNKRLNFLKKLIYTLCKQQIKFHIDAVVFDKNNRENIKNLLMEIVHDHNSSSIIEVVPVPYLVYMQNIADSKAIIDLYRLNPDEGLSFRTAEALALKKKIITNRDLNANNLYKFKENILSFDDIDKVNLREFIDKPYVDPDPELLKQFDIDEQINNYLKN